jgi:hypothetical protein
MRGTAYTSERLSAENQAREKEDNVMEWFLNLQFFSGLIIGASFGVAGGLVLGLVVGAPIASEIMAAEGSIRGSSGWHNFRALPRKSQSIDMTPPVSGREPSMIEKPKVSTESIDMTPPGGDRPRYTVKPVKGNDDDGSMVPPPPGISSDTGSGTRRRI